MRASFKTPRFKNLFSYFILALAILVAYKLINEINSFFSFLSNLISVISPFFVGFLIAYILNIPCGGLQRLLSKINRPFIQKRKKALSILIVYLALPLIFLPIVMVVVPSIYNSIYYFVANFQSYYLDFQRLIEYVNSLNLLELDINMESIRAAIRQFSLDNLPSSINALFGVSTALFNAFLGFISSIYILVEKESFKKYLCRVLRIFLPESVYNSTIKYTADLNKNFKRYLFTQTIDSCIIGTLATIELYIMGSPYALVMGIMLGIVNYIPYFGSIIGTIIIVVVVSFTQSITMGVVATVVLLITQQIDGNIIQPKLMSGSFSLSPLLVIISITIGGAFYGAIGMIVAIPIVAVVKNAFEEIVGYYEHKKNLSPIDESIPEQITLDSDAKSNLDLSD